MKSRRKSQACVALSIGLLALLTPAQLSTQTAPSAGPFACPAAAKPANLDFALKDLNGNDVRLAAYRGQVILLDFWATWCGPCKVEIPWFIDLQTRYGKQGLQVIGISVDDTLEKLKPYAAELKMNYPVLQGLGRDDVLDAFGPMIGFPTTLVISREGKICETHIGMSSKNAFETQVQGLLPTR
jgi:thiol-disulfide isomerase/thioredoxin